jgi:hypothetical protein
VGGIDWGADVGTLVGGSELGLRVGNSVGPGVGWLLPGHGSESAQASEAEFRASLTQPSMKLP